MCGIAAIYRRTLKPKDRPELDSAVTAMLTSINHRGGDACGVGYVDSTGTIRAQVAAIQAVEFNRLRKPVPASSRAVIMHTRFATQGSEHFAENNHPVVHGSAVIVHNGVISNDDEVFTALQVERMADVDTAAIAASLAERADQSIGDALATLEGSLAIAYLDTDDPDVLVLARGSFSPLFVIEGKRLVIAASTREAVVAGWKALHGTKPDHRRIVSVAEGTIITCTPKGVTWTTFEPKMTTYTGRVQYAWPSEDEGYWSKMLTATSELAAQSTATSCQLPDPVLDGMPGWHPVGKRKLSAWEDCHLPEGCPRGVTCHTTCLAAPLTNDPPDTEPYGTFCEQCGKEGDEYETLSTILEAGSEYRLCNYCLSVLLDGDTNEHLTLTTSDT